MTSRKKGGRCIAARSSRDAEGGGEKQEGDLWSIDWASHEEASSLPTSLPTGLHSGLPPKLLEGLGDRGGCGEVGVDVFVGVGGPQDGGSPPGPVAVLFDGAEALMPPPEVVAATVGKTNARSPLGSRLGMRGRPPS